MASDYLIFGSCEPYHVTQTSVYENHLETSDILSDIYMIYGGHSSKF